MYVVIDLMSIVLSVILLISNLKNIKNGNRYIIYYMFWIVYVLPLALDYIVGTPIYDNLSTPNRFFGFSVSYNDEFTRILYDLFIIITQLFILRWRWIFTFGSLSRHRGNSFAGQTVVKDEFLFSRGEMYLVIILAMATPLLCFATGKGWIACTFGWRELNLGQAILEQGNYSFYEKLSYLGVTASVFLLLWRDYERSSLFTRGFRTILAAALLYSNICIEGKRSILFFALIMCFMFQMYFGREKYALLKTLLSLCVIVAVVILTSVYVKTQFRGYSSFENLYTSFRVDLFRDDTVKMVIYSFTYRELKPLLTWPFQSYITQVYSIFPLDFLSGLGVIQLPRVGFNVYLSSALSKQAIETGVNFMTTSIADELIANFHVFGAFALGPLLVSISRFIDRLSPFEKILWIGGVVLLMLYSLNYIAYYLEAAVIVHLILKRRRITDE